MSDFDDVQTQIDEMLNSIESVHGEAARAIAGVIASSLDRHSELIGVLLHMTENPEEDQDLMEHIAHLNRDFSDAMALSATLMFKGAGISEKLGEEITNYAIRVVDKAIKA